jgi:hypothetical protein
VPDITAHQVYKSADVSIQDGNLRYSTQLCMMGVNWIPGKAGGSHHPVQAERGPASSATAPLELPPSVMNCCLLQRAQPPEYVGGLSECWTQHAMPAAL